MRPRIIALLAVSAIGLSLTACATAEPSNEPTATVTITATPSTHASVEPLSAEETPDAEESFLNTVNRLEESMPGVSDKELLDAGYEMCETYEYGSGDPVPQLIDAGDYSVPVNGVVMFTSENTLCADKAANN